MIELAGIIVLGIFAQWIAWRTRVPAILPLILIGLSVGPLSTLWSEDGSKWIEPIFNGTKGLFPGELLFYFVSLAIGIILFEGGLTLRRKEIKGVGPVIGKLISVGSLITFIGGGIAAHFIIGLNWRIAFLFSGLIIVTGPTVIAPILRNVPLNKNVSTVLKWEGILIDPIGALVAVLMYEFIITTDISGGAFSLHAFYQFLKIVFVGAALGGSAAYFLFIFIKRKWIPHYLLNVFTLALVLLAFVFSDFIVHESGLLTVVVMGMVLAELEVPQFEEILDFKESLSILLISILFILLSANINMTDLELLLDYKVLLLFIVVVFILRPASVFASTHSSELSRNEKAFISWVGPRGIVAAGIASLFGIRLTQAGVAGAEYITPLVFMIVLGTVLLNATTARLVAKLLNVVQKSSTGILIIGCNEATKLLAKYLMAADRHVVIVDNNPSSIKRAQQEGLNAVKANIYEEDFKDDLELIDMGYLMAMTSNGDVNNFAIDRFRSEFGENGTFRLLTPYEATHKAGEEVEFGLFSNHDDFLNLSRLARDYPAIHEVVVPNKDSFDIMLKKINEERAAIPIFYRSQNAEIQIFPSDHTGLSIDSETTIVYLGKEIG